MTLPTFEYEQVFYKRGFKSIAGVDEVGRGSFAGPVVAACVGFSSDFIHDVKTIEILINDSKKMSAKQRQEAEKWIKSNCSFWGIGDASVHQINKIGIKSATEIAFRKAVKNANKNFNNSIDFLLTDAFYIPNLEGLSQEKQKPIIKGDSKSISIAAASIIAKVYRDNLMTSLAANYKLYKWDQNKGYGTRDHREAIEKYGPTELHRTLFIRKLTSTI